MVLLLTGPGSRRRARLGERVNCIVYNWMSLRSRGDVILILSFIYIHTFFFLPLGLWDLSSLTRNQTLAPCNRNTESKPLNHQGSPSKGDVEYAEGYSDLKLCRNIKPVNIDLEIYQQIGGHLSHKDSPIKKE